MVTNEAKTNMENGVEKRQLESCAKRTERKKIPRNINIDQDVPYRFHGLAIFFFFATVDQHQNED